MITKSLTDHQILDEYRKTGQISLEVYETYNKIAFRHLLKSGALDEVADHIIHEAWIPFLRKLSVFESQGEGALYMYFQQICHNQFLNHCKKEKNNRSHWEKFVQFFKEGSEGSIAEENIEERKEKLLHHMMRFVEESLRTKCRQLFVYRYWEKLSMEEIDQRIGSNNSKGTSSAKNELYRCRKKLEVLMSQIT